MEATTTTTQEGPVQTIYHVATLSAADAFDAIARFQRVIDRWELPLTLGEASVRSAKHGIWAVEYTLAADADRDRCWVLLTSFGITPSGIGSRWETVKGVGC